MSGGLKKYHFSHSKANTFIGGVSATITTASQLATKLGISAGRVSDFKIIGSDIQAKITGGSYVIPSSCFNANTTVTYYDDTQGLVSSVGLNAFLGTTNLVYVKVKNATSLLSSCFQNSGLRGLNNDFSSVISLDNAVFTGLTSSVTTVLNFPALTTMNGSNHFSVSGSISNNITVNVPVALKTVNAGKPHASLTASNLSALIINYIGWTDTTSYDTEIGGLGSYFANKGLLAQKIGIGSGGIVNIQNVSGNLRMSVLAKHTIPDSAFNNNTLITSYDDSINGNVTNLGTSAFAGAYVTFLKFYGITDYNSWYSILNNPNLTTVEMPNMTLHRGRQFGNNSPLLLSVSFPSCTAVATNDAFASTKLKTISMPNCAQLGGTTGQDGVFVNIPTGATITVKASLQTANAGAPDGDLVYVSGRSGTIVYI